MTMTRRRLLIAAGTACVAGLGASAGLSSSDVVWRGTALGADSEIIISGLERGEATRLIRWATAEIERLEEIFSLYQPDSELVRLNQAGALENPSQDFRLLLEQSLAFHRATGGAFNVAIQPVWAFLARHFGRTPLPPEPGDLRDALACCDPGRMSITASRIALAPGMALTFNGIAQGYVTDQVAALFRSAGLRNVLISLGETRALPGRAWSIGIAGRSGTVALSDGAIAQSSGRGTIFTADGRWHHLIETGSSANQVAAVTVRTATATRADALSTALFVAPPAIRPVIIGNHPDIEVFWESRPLDIDQGRSTL
jgi:thiamine biosynthesis lipoprotein